MKRLRVILLFLLLGAIVNVAVAWGCATWVIPTSKVMRKAWVDMPGFEKITGWICYGYYTAGTTQLIAMAVGRYPGTVDFEFDELMPVWSDLAMQMYEAAEESRREAAKPENADIKDSFAPYTLMQHAFGFPFRCLYWNWENERGRVYIQPQERFTYSLNLKARPSPPNEIRLNEQRALPLGVIPLVFALNTVIFSSLLWLLINIPLALHHMIRRKRGLCVKCGYDLRGAEHEACPECGQECLSS